MEECGEVVQIAAKILRHGYESCHPNGGPTNRVSLERELGDVTAAVLLLAQYEDVQPNYIDEYSRHKQSSGGRYLHHNSWEQKT